MNPSKTNKEQVVTGYTIAISLVKGLLLALVVLGLLLFFCAILIEKNTIPPENMVGVVLASLVVASFVGGSYALALVQKYGLLLGLAVGLSLFLLLLFLGFCLYPSVSFLNQGFELLFASLCGGAMAKLFYKNKKKNRNISKKS